MKKKLSSGIFLIFILTFTPIFQLELSSDAHEDIPSKEQVEEVAEVSTPAPAPAAGNSSGESPYPSVLISSVGTLTYYNQSDPRWASAIYGGSDPISLYGCGPTALAMIVSSFTDQTITPDAMAQWASANYWVAGSGSKHSLIPEGAAAFGFHVESLQSFTVEGVKSALKSGNILVALMGPGHFTTSGHFIIITNYWANDQVTVADPAHVDNCFIPWDISLILQELLPVSDSGAPVWVISPN